MTSNHQGNPNGRYTTVGIYYIVQQSSVNLLYALSIRYTEDPVPFDRIFNWISEIAYDIAVEHAPRTAYVIEIAALTFDRTDTKPQRIRAY